jgi:hypothetical protein
MDDLFENDENQEDLLFGDIESEEETYNKNNNEDLFGYNDSFSENKLKNSNRIRQEKSYSKFYDDNFKTNMHVMEEELLENLRKKRLQQFEEDRVRREIERRKVEERNRIKAREDYYITNFEREKKRNIPIGDIIVYIFLFSILAGSLYMIIFK